MLGLVFEGANLIGTLGGRGVGDYTSLNRPFRGLIMGIKAPYPRSPYPPKGPYDNLNLQLKRYL